MIIKMTKNELANIVRLCENIKGGSYSKSCISCVMQDYCEEKIIEDYVEIVFENPLFKEEGVDNEE